MLRSALAQIFGPFILAAALLLIALPAYYLSIIDSEYIPLRIRGLTVLKGDATRTATGWQIGTTATGDQVVLGTQFEHGLNTDGLSVLNLRAQRLPSTARLALLWAPSGSNELRYIHTIRGTQARINLRQLDNWPKELGVLGLALEGALPTGGQVTELSFGVPATLKNVYQQIGAHWFGLEGWSQYSINRIRAASRDPLKSTIRPSPVSVISLWMVTAFSLCVLSRWLLAQPVSPFALLAPAVAAWLMLDLRWQWDMAQQLPRTYAEYAESQDTSHILSEAGGEAMIELVAAAKSRLDTRDQVVIASRPRLYGLYARYLLLPVSATTVHRPKRFRQWQRHLRSGDAILIFGQPRISLNTVPIPTREWEEHHIKVSISPHELRPVGSSLQEDRRAPADFALIADGTARTMYRGPSDLYLEPGYYHASVCMRLHESGADSAILQVIERNPDSGAPNLISEREVRLATTDYESYSVPFVVNGTASGVSFKAIDVPKGAHVATITISSQRAPARALYLSTGKLGPGIPVRNVAESAIGSLFMIL